MEKNKQSMSAMEKNEIDNKFKELLSGAKTMPSENLKYRIMHQIETEQQLSEANRKNLETEFLWKNALTSLVVVYLFMIFAFVIFYFHGNKSFTSTPLLWAVIILIAFICSTFYLISVLDDRRQEKWRKTRK